MEDKLGLLIDKLENKGNNHVYYDEYLDMELEIKKFSLRRFSKMQEGADKNTDKALETMYKIIYEHVPLFQSDELFEKSGVQKRENVIAKIYDEKLKPIEKIFNFINVEVYQLDVDVEKKS
ncbi:hypothetical protein [Streptobacillus canis]|uniref:hypothetical protein n=1 Tax=Streptobacillus canis TaxID=2678686 RepID=UPI0012E169F9|nr:hypothetical protein [Streptobacillus canis]